MESELFLLAGCPTIFSASEACVAAVVAAATSFLDSAPALACSFCEAGLETLSMLNPSLAGRLLVETGFLSSAV